MGMRPFILYCIISIDAQAAFSHSSQGQYGCDSPETLVNSMIANMKQMVPNPAFIVVSGDSAAHDMTMADTLASIRYVMSSLQDAYPRVPLYPVIGMHLNINVSLV